jgi:hypothetical protein
MEYRFTHFGDLMNLEEPLMEEYAKFVEVILKQVQFPVLERL